MNLGEKRKQLFILNIYKNYVFGVFNPNIFYGRIFVIFKYPWREKVTVLLQRLHMALYRTPRFACHSQSVMNSNKGVNERKS